MLSSTSLNHKPFGKVNKLAALCPLPSFHALPPPPLPLAVTDGLSVGEGRFRIKTFVLSSQMDTIPLLTLQGSCL